MLDVAPAAGASRQPAGHDLSAADEGEGPGPLTGARGETRVATTASRSGSRQPGLIGGLEERRHAARRQEDDRLRVQLRPRQRDQPGHRLARVDGIEKQPFGASGEAYRAETGAGGGTIAVADLITRDPRFARGRRQIESLGHFDRQSSDGGRRIGEGSGVDPEHPIMTKPCCQAGLRPT